MPGIFRRLSNIFGCFSPKSKSLEQPKNVLDTKSIFDYGFPKAPNSPFKETDSLYEEDQTKDFSSRYDFDSETVGTDSSTKKAKEVKFRGHEHATKPKRRDKTDVKIEASSIKTDLFYEMNPLQGGFGSVAMGYLHGKPVAIKKLLRNDCPSSFKKAFKQECKILSIIRHPNIVNYIGTIKDEQNTLTSLVTEWCQGGDLTSFFNKSWNRVSSYNLIDIAIQISEGMGYLHQIDIIHRDLKVKIGDFGCSAFRHNANERLHKRIGTKAFMAPEVVYPDNYPGIKEIYSTKSDVYSFGLLLFHIATGQIPYAYYTDDQIFRLLMRKELEYSWNCIKALGKTDIPCNVLYLIRSTTSYVIHTRPDFFRIIEVLKNSKNYMRKDLTFGSQVITRKKILRQYKKSKFSSTNSFPRSFKPTADKKCLTKQ